MFEKKVFEKQTHEIS